MNSMAHNKKGRYVVLWSNVFSERDWHRMGLAYFESQGYEPIGVECYDLIYGHAKEGLTSDQHSTYENVTIPESLEELEAFLLTLTPNDLVVNMITLHTHPELYELIRRLDLPYAYVETAQFPWRFCYAHRQPLKQLFKHLSYDLRSMAYRVKRAVQLKIFWGLVTGKYPPARWLLTSGEALIKFMPNQPFSAKSEFIQTVADDIFLLQAKDKENQAPVHLSERPYVVFLDSPFWDHPDFKMTGITPPLDADKYYKALLQMFDRIEQQYNVEIVIAGHPRCDYNDQEKRFGVRRVYAMKTAELVKDSAMVISHVSTAVSFAVHYRKPILFITNDDLEDWRVISVDQAILASWFGQDATNIDALAPDQDIPWPDVDDDDYTRYEASFLGPRDFECGHPFEPLKTAFENSLRT